MHSSALWLPLASNAAALEQSEDIDAVVGDYWTARHEA